MEKFVYYNNLFDLYNSFLTSTQQNIFKLYYEENLSMQEIAEINNVSKSFIGKSVKDIITKLDDLENNLHLLEIKNKLNELLNDTDINKIKIEIKNIVNKL